MDAVVSNGSLEEALWMAGQFSHQRKGSSVSKTVISCMLEVSSLAESLLAYMPPLAIMATLTVAPLAASSLLFLKEDA